MSTQRLTGILMLITLGILVACIAIVAARQLDSTPSPKVEPGVSTKEVVSRWQGYRP